MNFILLRKILLDEDKKLKDMLSYFQKYKIREEEHETCIKKNKEELGKLSSNESHQRTRKLIGLLSSSYEMYSVKSENIESLAKKIIPAIQELRGELSELRETTEAEEKKVRKLSADEAKQQANRLKQVLRKYLTKQNKVCKLAINFHGRSCLNESSQYVEKVSNLMHKMKPSDGKQ